MAKKDDPASTRKLDQEVRARLAAILNASEDAIIGNTLDGIITAWNKAAERIYSYSASEAIGRPIAMLAPSGCRDEVSRILERVRHGEHLGYFERVHIRKDGTPIKVRVSVSPLVDEGGHIIGVSSIARDITEREKTKEELAQFPGAPGQKATEMEEGHKIPESLVGNLPDGIAIYYDANYMLLYISRYAIKLAGKKLRALQKVSSAERAENLGIYLADVITKALADNIPLMPAVRSGQVVKSGEFLLKDAEGKTVPVVVKASPLRDRNGKISGALVAWRDATDGVEMEQKLPTSEEHYRTLVEWAPDAIIVHRDGRFLYVNCPALGVYGAFTREQLQEHNFFDMVHPEDQSAVRIYFEQIQGGEKMSLHDFRLVRTDGRAITVEAAGMVIDYDGAPAYLIILRDISDRQRIDQERLRAVEELRKQERLLIQQGRFAAMGEMLSNIAHHWRQPLNTLGLIVQELPVYYKLGIFNQKYLKESVNKAMRAILQMSKTIDDFSNFLKPDKERVRFRIGDVVHKTVSMVEAPLHELGLQIQIAIDEEVSIEGYPNEYAQVILNILMNAKDALMEHKTERPLVVLRLFREHGKSVLTVTDNAGGIPDEIIGRVFDPYFTTKSPGRGAGIGLFLSKTIIEKNMSGSLNVRNVTGGAQFRIEV